MSVPLTFPLTATGLSIMACIPRMEDWGGLMIGVPIMEPNTPPLEIVNVPPSISSMANSLTRALETKNKKKYGQLSFKHTLAGKKTPPIGCFRAAFCFDFKTSLCRKEFIFIQTKLIFMWRVLREDWFWNRGEKQLENALLSSLHSSLPEWGMTTRTGPQSFLKRKAVSKGEWRLVSRDEAWVASVPGKLCTLAASKLEREHKIDHGKNDENWLLCKRKQRTCLRVTVNERFYIPSLP